MHAHLADFHRLTLLIQRILDADALYDTEGTALLTETQAACRSLEEGDLEAARQHVAQVVHFTEALIGTDALALSEGSAVIETAHRILAGDTD
jgi:hypothetical protein